MTRNFRTALCLIVFAAGFAPSLFAQWVNVTASHIQDTSGGLLANGLFCVQPVDNSNHPVYAARVGGSGGPISANAACKAVTNGVLASGSQMPDTSISYPQHLCVRVTIKDLSQNGVTVYTAPCVQPSSTSDQAYWCTTSGATTCNYDLFNPNLAPQIAVTSGPVGPAPNVTAGTVTTLSPGASATASVTGTSPNFAINLGIPTGAAGPTGATGPAGANGANGANGTNGANGAPGANGVAGPSVVLNARGNWAASTSYAIGDSFLYGGGFYNVQTAYTSGSVFGATDQANTTLGLFGEKPIAKALSPDALQQQLTAYTDQTSTINSVADANAKAVLLAMNTGMQNMQNVCIQSGICVPNTLAQTIASTSGAIFILFNASGSATPALTVNAALGTDTWTATPSTGSPNFVLGGIGQLQGGWVQQGPCAYAGQVIPSGAAITTATTTLNSGVMSMATCAGTVTSSAKVQGGGALTSANYPTFIDTSTSKMTLYPAGGTVCWWGNQVGSTNTSGVLNTLIFQSAMSKANEFTLGVGYGGVYNGSALQTYTFPNNSYTNQVYAAGNNGSYHYIVPEATQQMCLVYNPSLGSFGAFTLYMADGSGNFSSGQINLTSALAATSASQVRLNGLVSARHEAVLYLPGVFLTQTQIAGLYHGFTSTPSSNPYSTSRNQGPAFNSAPAVQWNTYPVTQNMTQDCPYFVTLTNGGNSPSGSATGSLNYNGTFSQCHVKVATPSPTLRVTLNPGIPAASGDISVRVDGVLQEFESYVTSQNVSTIVVNNSAGGGTSDTYDFNFGIVGGNTTAGFTPTQLYSGLSGVFPRNIEVPNPYTITSLTESGTVAFCVTDSIVCTGYETSSGYDGSSFGTFLPIQRYSTGTTSFNTANISALGFGGILLDTDFNTYPTITTSGSVPTAAASTYVSTYANRVTNSTPANAAVNIVARGINDITHGLTVYGAGSNCAAGFAFSLKNELAAWTTYNASIKHYVFSPINYSTFAEAVGDGCTGNSYTTVNAMTVQEYSAGAWSGVAVSAGTTWTGSLQVWQYRAIMQDVCISQGSNCTYVELGPGAPTLTGGYQMPNLQQTVGQCWNGTSNFCYFSDLLHLTPYGHWLLARYINAQPWATSQALKEFAMLRFEKSMREGL